MKHHVEARILALVCILFGYTINSLAAVTIRSATGGAGISADKAANATNRAGYFAGNNSTNFDKSTSNFTIGSIRGHILNVGGNCVCSVRGAFTTGPGRIVDLKSKAFSNLTTRNTDGNVTPDTSVTLSNLLNFTNGKLDANALAQGLGFSIAGNNAKPIAGAGTKPYTFTRNASGNEKLRINRIAASKADTLPMDLLPVALINFNTILLNNRSVNLSWQTVQETNSNYFDVERSADGNSWKSIGTEAASGNKEYVTNYSFLDNSPIRGAGYYRLKMVNEDGSFNYSEVSVITVETIVAFKVFPNPASGYVNVSVGRVSDYATIRLFNLGGQAVYAQQLDHATGKTITIPVGNLSVGTYFVQVISSDGSEQVSSIIIVR